MFLEWRSKYQSCFIYKIEKGTGNKIIVAEYKDFKLAIKRLNMEVANERTM